MARSFNLTAELNLRGPNNIGPVINNIRRQLTGINVNVGVRVDPRANRDILVLQQSIARLNTTLTQTQTVAASASNALSSLTRNTSNFNTSVNNLPRNIGNVNSAINSVGTAMNRVNNNVNQATQGFEAFGRQSALAVRRFAAFATVTGIIFKFTNAISSATSEFIGFNKELVRVAQVTDSSLSQLSPLVKTITSLSTSMGIASKDLIQVSSTLAQAGLSAKETEKALKALALSALAPSFDSLNDTVEGSIALMRQFGIKAGDLEAALGSINAVAAKFAVESSDIITAIQRTGGVFAAASKGVSEGKDALNEFISVFTSVRATTRESAETIATGLRTIFTRIQRGGTIDALKDYGVVLTDLSGKFVGPYEAVKRLSEGLNKLDPRDLKFSQIVEELGGFRQIGKVIPLIQQFATAQQALKVAQEGQASLGKDAATAQLSVANRLVKVREEFNALIRSLGESSTFQTFVKLSLDLASALIKLADSAKTVLPALTAIAAFKGAAAVTRFGSGFFGGMRRQHDGGYIRGFASGGYVPGQGDSDTVPAMLTPGEFVIRKKAVQVIGVNNLHNMNKYASGGKVRKMAGGGYPLVDDLPNAKGAMLPAPGIKPGSPLYEIIKNGGGALDYDRTLQRTLGDKAYSSAKTPSEKEAVLKKYFRDPLARLQDAKTARLTQFGKQLQELIKNGTISPKNLSIISKSKRVPGIADHIHELFGIPVQNMVFTSGESKEPALDAMRLKGPRINRVSKNFGGFIQKFAQINTPPSAGLVKQPSNIAINRWIEQNRGSVSTLKSRKQTALLEQYRTEAIRALQQNPTLVATGIQKDTTRRIKKQKQEQRLIDRGEKFALVGLFGGKGTAGRKSNNKPTVPLSISYASLDNVEDGRWGGSLGSEYESVMKGRFRDTIRFIGRDISGRIGANPVSNEDQIDKIMKKVGVETAIGAMLEGAIGIAGAPYAEGVGKQNASIDFPNGLGSGLASLFGLPSEFANVPTDATRNVKGKGISGFVAQISRYLDQQNNSGLEQAIADSVPTGAQNAVSAKKRGRKAYAVGGSVEDTVPALLTPGEFVINKKAASRLGAAKLHQLNSADKLQGFNKGGAVGVVQKFTDGGFPDSSLNNQARKIALDLMKSAGISAKSALDQARDQVRSSIQGPTVPTTKMVPQQLTTPSGSRLTEDQKRSSAIPIDKNIIDQRRLDRRARARGADTALTGTQGSFAGFDRASPNMDIGYTENSMIYGPTKVSSNTRDTARIQANQTAAMLRGGRPGGVSTTTTLSSRDVDAIPTKPSYFSIAGANQRASSYKDKAMAANASGPNAMGDIYSGLAKFNQGLANVTQATSGFVSQLKTDPLAVLKKSAASAANGLYSIAKGGISSGTGSILSRGGGLVQSIGGGALNMMGLGRFSTAGRRAAQNTGGVPSNDNNQQDRGSGMGGMGGMAAFAIPMVAGPLIDQISKAQGGESTEAGRKTSAIGSSVLNYGSTGAMIGSMFGPWGTAIGAASGALVGFVAGLDDADKATQEYSRAQAQAKTDTLMETSSQAIDKFATDPSRANRANMYAQYSKATASEEQLGQTIKQEKVGRLGNIANFVTGGYAGYKNEDTFSLSKRKAESQKAGADQAEKILAIEMMNAGKTFSQLSSSMDPGKFKTLTQNIAEADVGYQMKREMLTQRVSELTAAGNPAEAKRVQEEGNKELEALSTVIAQRVTLEESNAAKAKAEADAKQALINASIKAAMSIEKSFEIMEQSFNKFGNEIDNLSNKATQIMSGKASLTSSSNQNAINVLQNPDAYSEKERKQAIAQASSNLGPQGVLAARVAEFGPAARNTALRTATAIQSKPAAGGDIKKQNEDVAAGVERDLINQILTTFGPDSPMSQTLISGVRESAAKMVEEAGSTPIDAEKLVDSAAGPLIKASENAGKQLINSLQATQKAFSALGEQAQNIADLQQKQVDRTNAARERAAQNNLSLRAARGEDLSSEDKISSRMTTMAQRLGFNSGSDVTASNIAQKRSAAVIEQQRLQGEIASREQGGIKTEDQARELFKFKQELAAVNQTIESTDKELANLGDTLQNNFDDVVAEIQKKVSEIETRKEAKANFAERLVTSTPQEMKELSETYARLQGALSGNIVTIERSKAAQTAYSTALQSGKSRQEAMTEAQSAFANENKKVFSLFNDMMQMSGVKGDEFDKMRADLLENMAKSQGLGLQNSPMFKSVIKELRTAAKDRTNPEIDALMQKADIIKNAQAEAVKEQNQIDRDAQKELLNGVVAELVKQLANIKIEVNTNVANQAAAVGQNVPVARNSGGIIYASNGKLINFQPKGTDTVPAMLTPGEFVVNRSATQKNLGLLQSINSGDYYDDGGPVRGRVVQGVRLPDKKDPDISSILNNTNKANNTLYENSKSLKTIDKTTSNTLKDIRESKTFSSGGVVYASKGTLVNYQPKGTDTVPAMLTPGEFVVNRQAAQKNMGTLQAINNGYYTNGGPVLNKKELMSAWKNNQIFRMSDGLTPDTWVVGFKQVPFKGGAEKTRDPIGFVDDTGQWVGNTKKNKESSFGISQTGWRDAVNLRAPSSKEAYKNIKNIMPKFDSKTMKLFNGSQIYEAYDKKIKNKNLADLVIDELMQQSEAKDISKFNIRKLKVNNKEISIGINTDEKTKEIIQKIDNGQDPQQLYGRATARQNFLTYILDNIAGAQNILKSTEPKFYNKQAVDTANSWFNKQTEDAKLEKEAIPKVWNRVKKQKNLFGLQPSDLKVFTFDNSPKASWFDKGGIVYAQDGQKITDTQIFRRNRKPNPEPLKDNLSTYLNDKKLDKLRDKKIEPFLSKLLKNKNLGKFLSKWFPGIGTLNSMRTGVSESIQDNKNIFESLILSMLTGDTRKGGAIGDLLGLDTKSKANDLTGILGSIISGALLGGGLGGFPGAIGGAFLGGMAELYKIYKDYGADGGNQKTTKNNNIWDFFSKKQKEEWDSGLRNKTKRTPPKPYRPFRPRTSLRDPYDLKRRTGAPYRETLDDLRAMQYKNRNENKKSWDETYRWDGVPWEDIKKTKNKSNGGMVYANNGMLIPYSPKGTDTVPAMLTPGEFVVNKEATQKNLPLLRSINRFKGGSVSYLANGTPGASEFQDNVKYLSEILKFGADTLSKAFDEAVKNLNKMAQPTTTFSSSSGVSNNNDFSKQTIFLENFGNKLDNFVDKLYNWKPPAITLDHQVNVVVNGASILQNVLTGPIGNMVENAIQKAFDKKSRQNEGN